MGIKNLSKFLQKQLPTLYQRRPLSHYAGKKIAIDITLYLYRFKQTAKSRWLSSLINMILMLKKNDIQGIFVYDTKAPEIKGPKIQERKRRRSQATHRIDSIRKAYQIYEESEHKIVDPILVQTMERSTRHSTRLLGPMDVDTFDIDSNVIEQEIMRLEKQNIYVSTTDFELSKEFLRLAGLVYINSESEAETLCSFLCCHGYVDAVLSNDTDVMVYGTPLFLTNLNKGTVQEIQFEQITKGLGITYEQFRDFCIMCGTDYNSNIYRVGCVNAYKYLQRYGTIEGIRDGTNLDTSVLLYEKVRDIFTVPSVLEEPDLTERKPDIPLLEVFLVENHYSPDIAKNFSKGEECKLISI